MGSTNITVVYRPRSSLLDIIDVADANGWQEAQRFERGERQLEEVIYELPDSDTVVRGIDDHFVTVVFAAISGPGSADAEKLLRSSEATLDDATLWRWASSGSGSERSHALRALAAISEAEVDPRVVDIYTKALQDADPEVRQALIDSVGRAAWQELWPVVDELYKLKVPGADVLRRSYERHVSRK